MVMLASLLLVIIFFLIASLHFYWGVGGRWAIDSVVPTNDKGERILKTSPLSCFVVGFGLLSFSIYYLMLAANIELPFTMRNSVGWIIPSIFLLRGIGDFKYAGFMKKEKGTTFGRLDSTYFTPLCLLIAALGFVAVVFS